MTGTSKKEIAIKLTRVSKKYIIHHEKPTLAERIIDGKNEEFMALKNVSLTIRKGERVGIIGPNGSGKTTLLKLIAGIVTPTAGKMQISGKIVSLIDLQAGFHPDLTGIQNIYLNGAILGMGNDEIKRKLQSIIDFADIGKFIDAPLYTYSSGMMLRLGFSVVVHSEPDILLIDESVSVGDESFQKRASSKVKELVNRGTTIVSASHVLEYIASTCQRILWLNKGRVIKDGNVRLVKEYKNLFRI